MLDQILEDMFIDPELLEELDEEQKEVLFCKMREEQIRRYNVWVEKAEKEEKVTTKKQKPKVDVFRKVDFLIGEDGNAWTWVMGEHDNDKSIEDILDEEAQDQATHQSETEAEEIRKKQEEEMRREQERLEKERIEHEKELERLAEEAARKSREEAENASKNLEKEKKEDEEKINTLRKSHEKRRKTSMISAGEAKEKRRSEIYQTFQQARHKLAAQAEESSKQIEQAWVEQEKKAKERENEKRIIARRAREEHRRSIVNTLRTESQIIGMLAVGLQNVRDARSAPGFEDRPPVVPPRRQGKHKASKPSSKQAVIEWLKEVEIPRGSPYIPGSKDVAPWFHGIITRQDAEDILNQKAPNSFLIRVSEKVWGYAVSYRAENRCKHFLVDASERGYQFFGTNQLIHPHLMELVDFHEKKPISLVGNELLLYPCQQDEDPPNYAEFLETTNTPSDSVSQTTYL